MYTSEIELENLFYHKLINEGYPEDRIARQYELGDYRADIAILPPGLAQEPMALFEVKNSLQAGIEWLAHNPRVNKLEESFSFPMYVYCVAENQLINFDTKNATKVQTELPSYDSLKRTWLDRRTYFSELRLKNFMVFKSAEFQFGTKLNVIIGENGSGKTQLIKLLYSIARSLVYVPENKKIELNYGQFLLKEVFKTSQYENFIAFSEKRAAKTANIRFALNGNDRSQEFSIRDKVVMPISALKTFMSSCFDNRSTVFLPTHELLSIFPGFNSLGQVYREKWPYDQTYSDCMAYLGLPVIYSQAQFASNIITEVEKAIHGHIYLNDQGTRFLMQMEKSMAVYEIPTVAEGWRKFGQLLQLINTGAIHPGSILFWDEPEANLNPRLMCLLAKIIVELSKLDIQVFVTTHSLFFLREIDMLTKADKNLLRGDVRYFNFVGKGEVEQGEIPEDLGNILLLDESLAQSERFLKMED